jgi:hypothetical protein
LLEVREFIFKKTVKEKNVMLYSADFIAFRGAWLRLEVDTKTGEIWAKLKHLKYQLFF